MVFPELLFFRAYADRDSVFQDAVLDAVVAQVGGWSRREEACRRLFYRPARRAPGGEALIIAPSLSHRGRLLAWVPKVFLPNYPNSYERANFTSGARGCAACIPPIRGVGGHEAPRFGLYLVVSPPAVLGFYVPRRDREDSLGANRPPEPPPARLPAPRLLLTLFGHNHRHRQAPSARPFVAPNRPRCIAAMPFAARAPAESTDRSPPWDGQAGNLRDPATPGPRPKRFIAHAEMAIADIDPRPHPPGRMLTHTFGDNARVRARRWPSRIPPGQFDFAAPTGRIALGAAGRAAFPFCAFRPGRCSADIATRPTTSRGPRVWPQRLKATGLEKL